MILSVFYAICLLKEPDPTPDKENKTVTCTCDVDRSNLQKTIDNLTEVCSVSYKYMTAHDTLQVYYNVCTGPNWKLAHLSYSMKKWPLKQEPFSQTHCMQDIRDFFYWDLALYRFQQRHRTFHVSLLSPVATV